MYFKKFFQERPPLSWIFTPKKNIIPNSTKKQSWVIPTQKSVKQKKWSFCRFFGGFVKNFDGSYFYIIKIRYKSKKSTHTTPSLKSLKPTKLLKLLTFTINKKPITITPKIIIQRRIIFTIIIINQIYNIRINITKHFN